jgi:hypothetical protein
MASTAVAGRVCEAWYGVGVPSEVIVGKTLRFALGTAWGLACLASPVAAAESSPILLYGPGEPDAASEAQALEVFSQQSAERNLVPRPRHVSSLLAEVPVVEIVGAEVVGCPGSFVQREVFVHGLDEALHHLKYVEVEEANAKLERLDALLPCLDGVLEREQLARIFFLQGVGLAFDLDEPGAVERFRRALVVHPALEWDESFPPDARTLFEQAFQEAVRTPSGTLNVEPHLGWDVQLWVDGAEIPKAGGSSSLGEGRHLVQWKEHDGAAGARMLQVQGGAEITVLGRADLAAAILGGGASDLVEERATQALESIEDDSGSVVYLTSLDASALLHRYEFDTGDWIISDMGTATRIAMERRRARNGRVLTVGGASVFAAGAGMGIWGYSSARGLYNDADQITSTGEYLSKAGQYANARALAYTGYALVGLGAVGVGSGVVMMRSSSSSRAGLGLTPWVGGGVGCAVHWSGF